MCLGLRTKGYRPHVPVYNMIFFIFFFFLQRTDKSFTTPRRKRKIWFISLSKLIFSDSCGYVDMEVKIFFLQ